MASSSAMRPFFDDFLMRNYCCGGGLLGGFGVPFPPLAGVFGLFCVPEDDVPVPNAALLPLCPLRFVVPCCPNPCNCGWYGVLIKNPRSCAGSYTNTQSLYLFLWLNSRIVLSLQRLATPTIGPPMIWPEPD